MTDSKAPARPPQVTLAGWVTILGSVFVVFSVFEFIANLRSIDTRERVQDTLADPPFDGMGVSLEGALSFLHVAGLVAGASATAAAILGWFVLKRTKSARLALSVVVVPLFFAGLVTGGFLSSMVAVSAVILWGRPARDWFNGISPAQREPEPPHPPHPPREPGPRAFEGFGQVPTNGDASADAPREATATATYAPPQHRSTYGPARPREVFQACLFTWVMSGLVLMTMLLAVLVLSTDSSVVQEVYESDSRFAEADLSVDTLRTATIVMSIVFSVWSLVAVVLALFAFLGHNWARITLIISAAVAALLSLLMVVAAPPLLVIGIACVFTIVMLTRRPANDWFTARSH